MSRGSRNVFQQQLASRLARHRVDAKGRRWVFVAYDQLNDGLGPLSREPPEQLGIVLVESPAKASQRPYHQQKLALVLTNLRHFALEQADRGVAVRHVVAERGYGEALRPLARELGPLRAMEPAERELRSELAPLVTEGSLEILPHEGWCTTPEDFEAAASGPPWRMDAFYRHVRLRLDILMERGRPKGGKWSFDAENRQRWRGEPPAPTPPSFSPDEVTLEVVDLIRTRFADHPGQVDPSQLPATPEDAERLWRWALERCVPLFGPFEDAMSRHSSGLFHTRVSALLNLHRLLPRRLVDDVVASDAPLASVEGFVRQVIGWREYVRHVHRATDGFRRLPGGAPPSLPEPGDGGFGRWREKPWPRAALGTAGGAAPSLLDAPLGVPPALWGTPSGLSCLDAVVADVWKEAWGHHITRLMVVANLMTLLGVSPRELTDWFWVAYSDAFDWVVEPNVLAMGTFAVGPLATTKPYVSGAAYLDKMGDHCKGCAFGPKRTCPVTPLYWDFLARNEGVLADNPRLLVPLAALRKRPEARRGEDRRIAQEVRSALAAGRALTPAALEPTPEPAQEPAQRK